MERAITNIPRRILFGLVAVSGFFLVVGFGLRFAYQSRHNAFRTPEDTVGTQNRDRTYERLKGGTLKEVSPQSHLDNWIAREIKNITPASAAELLKLIDAEEKGVFERSLLSTQVLIVLSDAGFPDDAWGLVNEGYGEIREYQIRALMGRWTIPLECRIKYLDSLNEPNERADGLTSLLTTLTPAEMGSLDPKKFRIGTAREKYAVEFAFSTALERLYDHDAARFANDARQMVTHAMKMAAAGEIGYDNLRRILSAYHFDDGFGTWDMLHEAGLAEAPTRDIRKNIITKMLRKDADRAFGVIMDGGGPDGNNPYLSIAVAEFYGIDSAGANKWLTDKVVDYPSAIRDRIYGEVAVVALKGGEAEAARGWAGLIQDETERDKIQRLLREKK